jgi:hypothetical protein
VLGSTLALSATANAAPGHSTANNRAVLRVSSLTAYRGGTLSLRTTCPEPSRSTRLESGLFASPALLPAQMSRQATWTVNVAPRQRLGSYRISLNCFELGTGRVTGTAEIRINVLGSLQRAESGRRHASAAKPTGHPTAPAPQNHKTRPVPGPTGRHVIR